MSFQDFGKGTGPKRPTKSQFTSTNANVKHNSSATTSHYQQPSPQQTKTNPDPFSQLSDGILQYQQNIGILERIIRQIGTSSDGSELRLQYETQLEVLQQLERNIEKNLKLQEDRLEQSTRPEAAKQRATWIKLNRDFRRVETLLKNMVLDAKRKINSGLNNTNQQYSKAHQGAKVEVSEEEERMQLEMQLQQDLLNEEIMREREHEIRNINRGMHQVNEIYKDLAHIVANQQDQIDQIEDQMENSRVNAEQGLSHIQKANEKASTASACIIS